MSESGRKGDLEMLYKNLQLKSSFILRGDSPFFRIEGFISHLPEVVACKAKQIIFRCVVTLSLTPGIYILAFPPPLGGCFLSKLKNREEFEGGLEKRKRKGGKEEKQ